MGAMNAPSPNARPTMFCRKCGYALVGLSSNRCPECGRDFDPAKPKSFLAHPPRVWFRGIVRIVVVLFCLSLPLDAYVGYLDWRVHVERKAINFLEQQTISVELYDTTPDWLKAITEGRWAWLWKRAKSVNLHGNGNNYHHTQIMLAVGDLKSLETLKVIYFPLIDVDLKPIGGLTGLRGLDFTGTEITDAGLGEIRHLKRLQWLDLRGTKITDAGLAQIINLSELRTLRIGSEQITDAGLAQLTNLKTLEELEIDVTRITDAGMAQLTKFPSLRELSLTLCGTRIYRCWIGTSEIYYHLATPHSL